MPRIKLMLPPTHAAWTKAPNALIDSLLPSLKDTELRIILVLLRQTVGWQREGRTVTLSYTTLRLKTGREHDALARAIYSLRRRGLIHTTNRFEDVSPAIAEFLARKSGTQQYKEREIKNSGSTPTYPHRKGQRKPTTR